MEFVRVIKGYNHLWAVKNPDKELDELTSLFEQWNDANYLFKFFRDNRLKEFHRPFRTHLKIRMLWKN